MLLAVAATPITATASGCALESVAEVRRILALELKQPVQALPSSPQTLVTIDCHDAERWVITLEAPAHALTRLTAEVGTLSPIAQPRAVALMVAEALTRLREAPVVSATAPPPIVSLPANEPRELPRAQVGVVGLGRLHASFVGLGGGVAAAVRLWRWLGLRFDAASVQGTATRASGVVFATELDGGVTLDARLETERWLLRFGVGLRAGRGSLEGRPSSGNVGGTVVGVLWGPQAGLSGEWHPVELVSLALGVDAGLWAPRLEGRVLDESAVQLGGLFGTAWVAVGLRW